MKIITKYLGEVDIATEKIIQFPSGLPGFQTEKRFVLLDIPGNDILQLLQSVQTTELAFIVTNPHHFYKEYSFALDEHILQALHIEHEKEVVILSILTIQEPFIQSTINLKAPIIVHANKRIGKQYILNDEKYVLKAPISLPLREEGGE